MSTAWMAQSARRNSWSMASISLVAVASPYCSSALTFQISPLSEDRRFSSVSFLSVVPRRSELS